MFQLCQLIAVVFLNSHRVPTIHPTLQLVPETMNSCCGTGETWKWQIYDIGLPGFVRVEPTLQILNLTKCS